MTPNIRRSIFFTLGLMVASVLLSPLGLGWLPFVVGAVIVAYVLIRHAGLLQQGSGERSADTGAATQSAGGGLAGRVRGQKAREAAEAERRRQAREQEQQEADCGLTHDERLEFMRIVQNMEDDRR